MIFIFDDLVALFDCLSFDVTPQIIITHLMLKL